MKSIAFFFHCSIVKIENFEITLDSCAKNQDVKYQPKLQCSKETKKLMDLTTWSGKEPLFLI